MISRLIRCHILIAPKESHSPCSERGLKFEVRSPYLDISRVNSMKKEARFMSNHSREALRWGVDHREASRHMTESRVKRYSLL